MLVGLVGEVRMLQKLVFARLAGLLFLAELVRLVLLRFSVHGLGTYARMKLAQRSPTMIAGAFVFARVITGRTEASATRRPSTP